MAEPTDAWKDGIEHLGRFIHAQRKLANLSLRELAGLTELSNAYLSQLERGLHEPSIRVINSIARALDVSAESLLRQAGILSSDDPHRQTGAESASAPTEASILADPRLTAAQKDALLAVYRGFAAREAGGGGQPPESTDGTDGASTPGDEPGNDAE